MAAPKQMVSGFNHNVKHRGQAYHVQTEDSGVGNPRIVTHLFVGGNILASKKISYGEIAGLDDLGLIVRELMEDQHKEVLRNLISGVYDHVGAAYQARSYQPGQLAAGGQPSGPAEVAPPEAVPAEAASPAEPLSPGDVAAPAAPPPLPAAAASFPPLFDPTPARPGVPFPPLFDPTAPAAATPGAAFPLLFDPTAPAPGRPAVPFPPLFDPTAVEIPAATAPFLPEEAVEAIFGEDILSEKSLDEVILSYLVEDEEAGKS